MPRYSFQNIFFLLNGQLTSIDIICCISNISLYLLTRTEYGTRPFNPVLQVNPTNIALHVLLHILVVLL
jgi:hypothetical protein